MPFFIVLFLSTVPVRGRGQCPFPQQVEAQLQPLISASSQVKARVVVETSAQGFALRLEDAEGQLIGERSLSSTATCEERAKAAAVVIATWLTALEAQTDFDALSPSSQAGSAPESAPQRSPELPAEVIEPRQPREPLPEPSETTLEVGAAVDVAIGAGVGLGVQAFGSVGARRTGWGGILGLDYTGGRWIQSLSGNFTWERAAIGVGPRYRRSFHEFFLEFDLQGRAGLVSMLDSSPVSGSPQDSALCGGTTLGARIRSHVGLWAGVRTQAWWGCVVSGQRLVPIEALLSLGASWQMN